MDIIGKNFFMRALEYYIAGQKYIFKFCSCYFSFLLLLLFFYFANYDHIQIPKCPLESRKFKGLKTTMSSVLGNFYRNSK